jgi:hypothetical protein
MASSLLESYGAGFWASPTAIESIRDRLFEIVDLWDQNKLPEPNEYFVDQFNRKILTEKLAQIFNVISS